MSSVIGRNPDLIKEFRYHIGHLLSFTLTDLDCLRFLHARQCSIERSVQMALKWDEWRHKILEPLPRTNMRYSPNIILTSYKDYYISHPQIDLLPCMHHGWDKEGRPILWVKLGLIQSKFNEIMKYFSTEDLAQYHLVLQEMFELRYDYMYTQQKRTVTNCVVVFDLTGFDRVTLDMDSVWLLKSWIHLDQNCFPERLHQLFIVNTPWYFSSLLGMFQPFIDKKTRKKIKIFQGDFLNALQDHIDLETIPKDLGGQNDMSYTGSPSELSGVSLLQIEAYVQQEFFNPESTRVTSPEEEASIAAIQNLAAKASRPSTDIQSSIFYANSRPNALAEAMKMRRSPGSFSPGSNRNSDLSIEMLFMSSVFSVKISGVEHLSTHDEYIIDVEYDDKVKWQVRHRYSEFDKFRTLILKIVPPSARKLFPPLPPKVIFGRRADKVVQHRREKLSSFLKALLAQIRSEAYFDGIKLSSRREEEHQLFVFLDAYKALQAYVEDTDYTSDEDGGEEGDDDSTDENGQSYDLSFRDREVVPMAAGGRVMLRPPHGSPNGGPLDQILHTRNRRVSAALFSVCVFVLSLVGNVYRLQS